MNAPFKPEPIVPILADVGVSISDLKRNPAAVVAEAKLRQVAILSRNKPVAYMISPEVWEYLCEIHDDALDVETVRGRLANPGRRVRVRVEDLV